MKTPKNNNLKNHLMRKSTIFLAFATLCLPACRERRVDEWQLMSPGQGVKVTVLRDPSHDGCLQYRVDYLLNHTWKNCLMPSDLGLAGTSFDLRDNLRFTGKTRRQSIQENYTMITGKRAKNNTLANELELLFENRQHDTLAVKFRAYDEGIAYRYQIRRHRDDSIIVNREYSSFALPAARVWLQPNDTLAHWALGYEMPYENAIPAGTPAPRSTGWLFPLLAQTTDSLWMLISEANVGRHYCASQLQANAPNRNYVIQIPQAFEGWFTGNPFPKSKGTMDTPWRFVVVGGLETIVESNMVHHLSDTTLYSDLSWIKPGIVSWSWWSDPYSPFYYNRLKKFVDFAALMGWSYSLVDVDWNLMKGGTLEQLAAYAASRDVGLILWYNSGGRNNVVRYSVELGDSYLQALPGKGVPPDIVRRLQSSEVKQYFDDAVFLPELQKLIGERAYALYRDTILNALRLQNGGPHDIMDDREKRRAEMARIAALGIRGIKVDFWGSDKQDIIQRYIELIEDAAEYRLVVYTHGCTIPRGWSKTYPNLLSMEAVMGAEMYGSPTWAELALKQNTTYPFIRNIAGPMDYTPVAFTIKNPRAPHLTTYAHELALTVIFESGVLNIADKPEAILAQPGAVVDFLKRVPVVWDDTWFIDGFPTDFVILARKSGNRYYVAGISGKNEARRFSFSLDFLENQAYEAQIFSDGQQSTTFNIGKSGVQKGDTVTLDVLPAGGFVMVLEPV
jgi:hypothetical protein